MNPRPPSGGLAVLRLTQPHIITVIPHPKGWAHFRNLLFGRVDGRFVRTLEPYSPKRSTFRLLLNPTSKQSYNHLSENFTLKLHIILFV